MALEVSKNNEIRLTRGNTARLTVPIKDNEGQPYTVQNDDVLTFSLRRTEREKDPIFEKVVKGNNNIHIKPEDTKELEFGDYVYKVDIVTADGDVYTVIESTTFEIKP